jgi:hypothetical protein
MPFDEPLKHIGNFLKDLQAIQEATLQERYSWLSNAGLGRYRADANFSEGDSAHRFSMKLLNLLENHPDDLRTLLIYFADNILNAGDRDTALSYALALSSQLDSPPPEIASLREFLLHCGIEIGEEDLFAVKAEQHIQRLRSAFVSDIPLNNAQDQPIYTFRDLLGPGSLFLFAPPGYGKSS